MFKHFSEAQPVVVSVATTQNLVVLEGLAIGSLQSIQERKLPGRHLYVRFGLVEFANN